MDRKQPLLTSLCQLTQWNSKNATIKARVSSKSAPRVYKTAKGDEGKLTSIELCDASGEMKCTLFNECVDLFEPILQVDKVYYISKFSVKMGNPKFCKTEFEMSLNKSSTVEEVHMEPEEIPKVRYSFVLSIAALQDLPTNSIVDAIGIISQVSPLVTLLSKKDGRELVKRSIQIVDSSRRTVELTLWADVATNFTATPHTVIAMKNVRVGEYNNSKNLSTIAGTHIEIDPNLDAARTLLQWYEENSQSLSGVASLNSHTRTDSMEYTVATFAELQAAVEQAISIGDTKPTLRKIKATLNWIKSDERAPLYYKAAPGSNHKVVENTSGSGKAWYCPKLNKVFFSFHIYNTSSPLSHLLTLE
eukprot:TRINITY_DN5641_c1_g1_i1.p1 TRINITY_DN5641_c1_g1~~TRINITY_DN5641_c1_g1_i1.p1  ORF type:complete len:371 (-),score=70.40 TRINITY_DN5641_c1_g1_i1:739-1821(-)